MQIINYYVECCPDHDVIAIGPFNDKYEASWAIDKMINGKSQLGYGLKFCEFQIVESTQFNERYSNGTYVIYNDIINNKCHEAIFDNTGNNYQISDEQNFFTEPQ